MQIQGQKQHFGISYAARPDRQTLGPVVATEVKLGNLSVADFGVGVATQTAFNYPLDGFLGLAFKGLNSGKCIPPVSRRLARLGY